MHDDFFDTINIEIDTLTNLYRRDTIIAYEEYLIHQNIPFAFAILDIDNFKLVNDNYGHQTGDLVLKEVGRCLNEVVKDFGFVGRYGGDEFIFIFPNMQEYDDVWKALFAILKSSSNLDFGNNDLAITYTVGCSRCPLNSTNIDELFTLADKGLYRGKIKGRNCFIIYLPEKHADINLQAFRDKVYSPLHLHSKVYRILTNKSHSLEINIKNAIDFVGPYLLIDHLCIERDGQLLYEYFQPISKVKDFKPYGDDLFEEYLSGIDAFCENVVMTSEHINSNLYKEFLNQNVYSCCLFELRAFDKTFGVLRADMTSVDTGRIWQNDDLVLLETLAHTIALISYSSKE